MTTDVAAEPLFCVVEFDHMTNASRALDNYDNDPWTKTFTRTQADETVAWREKDIVNRYYYRLVEFEKVPVETLRGW